MINAVEVDLCKYLNEFEENTERDEYNKKNNTTYRRGIL
jgi:phage FluMu protein Com